MTNRLDKHITVEESTNIQWVNRTLKAAKLKIVDFVKNAYQDKAVCCVDSLLQCPVVLAIWIHNLEVVGSVLLTIDLL